MMSTTKGLHRLSEWEPSLSKIGILKKSVGFTRNKDYQIADFKNPPFFAPPAIFWHGTSYSGGIQLNYSLILVENYIFHDLPTQYIGQKRDAILTHDYDKYSLKLEFSSNAF